ncbi:MAG: hypothetical protein P8Y95_15440 [Gammaproteobacteria bacterium]|jgi:hypothetical protein
MNADILLAVAVVVFSLLLSGIVMTMMQFFRMEDPSTRKDPAPVRVREPPFPGARNRALH